MSKESKPPAVPTPPKDTTKFYHKKSAITPILTAIGQLKEREDTTGKFARKVGRIRRAHTVAYEEIQHQRQDLVIENAVRYSADHPDEDKRGKPTPVYLTGERGEPVFKLAEDGSPTEERVIVPDQYNIKDPMAYQKAMKEFMDEIIVVECPAFLMPASMGGSLNEEKAVPELERFQKIAGKIIDPLLDLEEGSAATIPPSSGEPLQLVKDEPEQESPIAPPAVTEGAPATEEATAP
jgi:hypothetical protein